MIFIKGTSFTTFRSVAGESRVRALAIVEATAIRFQANTVHGIKIRFEASEARLGKYENWLLVEICEWRMLIPLPPPLVWAKSNIY